MHVGCEAAASSAGCGLEACAVDLGFDNSQEISTKVDHHARGIAHGMFVDRLIKHFQRSHPVRAALD